MILSKDYIRLFNQAAKNGSTAKMIVVFRELCNEIHLEEHPVPTDEVAKAAAIAQLFNDRNHNQSGKEI